MDSASWWWRYAAVLTVVCGLVLGGCPADDDDSSGDDDTAGDDDVGDDDAATEFYLAQELAGVTSGTPCPDCDYTLDITYTTALEEGTCAVCIAFPDGLVTLAYDSDYQGQYTVILLGVGGQWYFWYLAYPGAGGHSLEFESFGGGYTQTGYWDVSGDNSTMTGKAYNSEP